MQREILKGILLTKQKDWEWLAKQMEMNVNTLYVKMNGKGQFKYDEIVKIKKVLNLDDKQFNEVFPF